MKYVVAVVATDFGVRVGLCGGVDWVRFSDKIGRKTGEIFKHTIFHGFFCGFRTVYVDRGIVGRD